MALLQSNMDMGRLVEQQRFNLWLDGHESLNTREQAQEFLQEVGLALRYGATDSVPLASMYRATQRHVPTEEDEQTAHQRAFDLTNQLLAAGDVVEINVVAGRLALAHRALLPAIYRLRRDGRPLADLSNLSGTALRAFDFIAANASATAGEVRRHLGLTAQSRLDPAYEALAELQRELLVDRGPSSGSPQGIFYLTKDGYPYRVLHEAHPEVLAIAARLTREEAALQLLLAYLKGAVFAVPRRLASVFRSLLAPKEIDQAVDSLVAGGVAETVNLGRVEAVMLGTR